MNINDEEAPAKKKRDGELGKCEQCIDVANKTKGIQNVNKLNHRNKRKCKNCDEFVCSSYEGHCFYICGKCVKL